MLVVPAVALSLALVGLGFDQQLSDRGRTTSLLVPKFCLQNTAFSVSLEGFC